MGQGATDDLPNGDRSAFSQIAQLAHRFVSVGFKELTLGIRGMQFFQALHGAFFPEGWILFLLLKRFHGQDSEDKTDAKTEANDEGKKAACFGSAGCDHSQDEKGSVSGFTDNGFSKAGVSMRNSYQ